jgi:hypothetical protein
MVVIYTFYLNYPTLERLLLIVLKMLPTIGPSSTRTPITDSDRNKDEAVFYMGFSVLAQKHLTFL